MVNIEIKRELYDGIDDLNRINIPYQVQTIKNQIEGSKLKLRNIIFHCRTENEEEIIKHS